MISNCEKGRVCRRECEMLQAPQCTGELAEFFTTPKCNLIKFYQLFHRLSALHSLVLQVNKNGNSNDV